MPRLSCVWSQEESQRSAICRVLTNKMARFTFHERERERQTDRQTEREGGRGDVPRPHITYPSANLASAIRDHPLFHQNLVNLLCSEGSGPLARPTQTRHPPSVIARRKSSATPFAACPVHLFFFGAVRTSRSARIASGMRCFARNSSPSGASLGSWTAEAVEVQVALVKSHCCSTQATN